MINQVIIFGGHIQALALSRQAARINVPTILFLPDKYSVARFSNSVNKVEYFNSNEEILELLQKYKGNNTLLVPTSDEYIEYLDRNRKILEADFVIGLPSSECIEILSDKRNTYKFAERLGIPHPESYFPDTLEDIEQLQNSISYPIVVKPAIMYDFHKKFGKKAFLCFSKEELQHKCKEIAKQYPIRKLVLQEFLSGGAETLFSFGVLACQGEAKSYLMANRIRQNPMDFGNSTTFAVICNIQEIKEIAIKLLKELNYTGLAEIEFMYDRKSGQYKFLEINTRAWKWHSISEGLGFGFFSNMIHLFNNESLSYIASNNHVAWVERLTDFAVILKEMLKGRMKFSNVISDYKRHKVNAVWSLRDPLPAIMYLLMSPILYLKRY